MSLKSSIFLRFKYQCRGGTVAQWLALLLTAPGTRVRFPAWVTVCVEFAHSPRVCMGFLPQSKDVQVRCIGHAQLLLSILPTLVAKCYVRFRETSYALEGKANTDCSLKQKQFIRLTCKSATFCYVTSTQSRVGSRPAKSASIIGAVPFYTI